MAAHRFHRHFATKGIPLYWIIIVYLIAGYFFPVIGLLALICMIAPVAMAVKRGRWWCGNACPRGSLYDRVLSKYSPHRPIPQIVRTKAFRTLMLAVIFTVFGIQMYHAWGDIGEMGRIFWRIILLTTVVGVVLSFIFAPRTWCSFCPMGTLSAWATPKSGSRQKKIEEGRGRQKKIKDISFCPWVFCSKTAVLYLPLSSPISLYLQDKQSLRRKEKMKVVKVGDSCNLKCKICARVCPMQLTPYEGRGNENGYVHPDCIKCGKCAMACPLKTIELSTN